MRTDVLLKLGYVFEHQHKDKNFEYTSYCALDKKEEYFVRVSQRENKFGGRVDVEVIINNKDSDVSIPSLNFFATGADLEALHKRIPQMVEQLKQWAIKVI